MNSRIVALCLLCTVGLAMAAQGEERLRVLNWKNYLDPAVLQAFEQKYRVKVDYRTFTEAGELEAALASNTPYDVVVPSHFQLARLIDAGRLQPLDKSRLPAYANLDPDLLALLHTFAGAERFVVPYLWTSIGLVVDSAAAEKALGQQVPNSWGLLFDPASSGRLQACGIGWLNAPEEMFSLWLNYRGKRLDRVSTRTVVRVGEALAVQRATAASLNNEAYIMDLADGRLCVAMAWAGHALTAMAQRPSLRYLIPEEGGLLTIDSWAIPSNAAQPELAHHFINFMLMPENARLNSLATLFYPPLRAHLPSMQALAQSNLQLIPDTTSRRRLYFVENVSEEVREAVNQQWSTIQQARASH